MAVPPIVQSLFADPIGNFPVATVACFDPTIGGLPRRHLAAQRTIEFIEKLAEAGAPALLIAASTGQGHARTLEELIEWFTVASQARRRNAMLSALLRPEDGPEANNRLAMLLAHLGYAAVFVRPGKNLTRGATEEEVAANMLPAVQAIARAGMAVGLYSIPDVSGLPMTPGAAARCLAAPGGERIVAIKVTEAAYERSTLLFLRDARLARLKIVQGWDPHLARALLDGPEHDRQRRQRCGVTSGPMSFAIYQYLHILAAAQSGNWDEVGKAQAAVTVLFQAMQDDPGKFADLQRAKHVMGLGQPITGEVTSSQVERVFAALESLPRLDDQSRIARSLDLLGDGLYHQRLRQYTGIPTL
jgi:dihydrodipicolinate synthase/N-acetylneuraminate lyase